MNLQIGVKILVKNDEGEYLFIRRNPARYPETDAHWDIPGGRIDTEEKLLPALARELGEETGLTLSSNPKLCAAQDIFVPAKDLHVVRLTYTGRADGLIALGDEHLEYAWMSREQALGEQLDTYIREVMENGLA